MWVPIGVLSMIILKKFDVIEHPAKAMGSKVGIWGKVPYPGGYQIRQLPVYSTICTANIVNSTHYLNKAKNGFSLSVYWISIKIEASSTGSR